MITVSGPAEPKDWSLLKLQLLGCVASPGDSPLVPGVAWILALQLKGTIGSL